MRSLSEKFDPSNSGSISVFKSPAIIIEELGILEMNEKKL